ncbi:MAG: RlpA-like double-psi beta-barrel domain-containing protein, partial [Massilia sp.]
MYLMTAAHPTLPIPSYARITSLESGKQVVVRINDRGPFHASRVIDVSYTAALKLGLLGKGSHEVEVERLLPDDPARLATRRRNAPLASEPQVAALPVVPATFDGVAQVSTAPIESSAPQSPSSSALQPASFVQAAAATPPATVAGFYLQLGAFSQADKAEGMRAKLTQSGVLGAALDVVQGGALHRLFCGPFASRAEALQAARSVPASMGLKPMVVRRD